MDFHRRDFKLEWGPDEHYALGSLPVPEYDSQNHLYATTISGLEPATLYHYRVVLSQQYFSAGTFRTAPTSSETKT